MKPRTRLRPFHRSLARAYPAIEFIIKPPDTIIPVMNNELNKTLLKFTREKHHDSFAVKLQLV